MQRRVRRPNPKYDDSSDQEEEVSTAPMGRVKDAATVERIEDLFKRGQLEQWEQELKAFSNGHEERGKIYFIQSQVVPPRPGGGPWGMREVCKFLRPAANWDDIEEPRDFENQPVVVLNFLGGSESVTEALAEVNCGKVSEFFERNDMTIRGCRERKGKSYKPPQRHEDNRCIKNPQVMNTPHSEWFTPAQGSKGMTDAMDVRYGVGALVDGVPDIPAEMLREVEEGLAFSQEFQSERTGLVVFDALREQVKYLSATADMFVRMHDGRCIELDGPPKHSAYIDGTAGPTPSFYIERSGLDPSRVWYTKTHNEFACMTFANLLHAGGTVHESLVDVLRKDAAEMRKAREESQTFKLWIFVSTEGENLKRADVYAKEVHKVDNWSRLVDWEASDLPSKYYVRLADLLDYGVNVSVTIQRVGDMVVGGPGLQHSVHQVGTSVAVAVNDCDLDYLHLAYRTRRGGDLTHRANLKTHGPKGARWYDTTAKNIAHIMLSLERNLDRILSYEPPAPSAGDGEEAGSEQQPQQTEAEVMAEKRRRLQKLLGEVNMLGTSLEKVVSAMHVAAASFPLPSQLPVEGNDFVESYKHEGWRELAGERFMELRDRVLEALAQIAAESAANLPQGEGQVAFPTLEEERSKAAAAKAKRAAASAARSASASSGSSSGPSSKSGRPASKAKRARPASVTPTATAAPESPAQQPPVAMQVEQQHPAPVTTAAVKRSLEEGGEKDDEDAKNEPMSAKEEVESPPRHKRARTGEAAGGGGEDMSMLVDGQPVDEEQGAVSSSSAATSGSASFLPSSATTTTSEGPSASVTAHVPPALTTNPLVEAAAAEQHSPVAVQVEQQQPADSLTPSSNTTTALAGSSASVTAQATTAPDASSATHAATAEQHSPVAMQVEEQQPPPARKTKASAKRPLEEQNTEEESTQDAAKSGGDEQPAKVLKKARKEKSAAAGGRGNMEVSSAQPQQENKEPAGRSLRSSRARSSSAPTSAQAAAAAPQTATAAPVPAVDQQQPQQRQRPGGRRSSRKRCTTQ